MTIELSDELRNEPIGSSIVIGYYSLGDGTERYQLSGGLWDEDTRIINLTLSGDDSKAIILYYTYLGGGDLIPAATLTLGEDEVLCEKTHLSFRIDELPCNIYVKETSNEIVRFLEKSTNLTGTNLFLVENGLVDPELPVTKRSFEKYYSRKENGIFTKPLALNDQGEKIHKTTIYKHYKSITIEPSNPGSKVGGSEYSYGNGSTISILGYCVYDLYEVGEGTYVLKEENKREDLTYTRLEELTGQSDCFKEVTKNQLVLDSPTGRDRTLEFISSIEFISEISFINDKEEFISRGSVVKVSSNKITMSIFFRWSVDYSTNLSHEDGHAMILFDTEAGSGCWNPRGTSPGEGEIVVYTEKKILDKDIVVVPVDEENQEIFDEYFSYSVQAYDFDLLSKKYKYVIHLETLKSTKESLQWFPLDKDGNSKEFCCTIRVLGGDPVEDIKFHCVQRPGKLIYFVDQEGNEVTEFQAAVNSPGLHESPEFWVMGAVEGYSSWEVGDVSLAGQVVFPSRLSGNLEDSVNEGTGIKLFYRGINFTKRLRFKRIKDSTRGYDPTNWKDLIYCYPSTDLILSHEAISTTSLSLVTPYSYDSNLLFIFDGKKNESKNILLNTASQGIAFDSQEDRALFEKYFCFSSVVPQLGRPMIRVVVNTISDIPDTDWYPKTPEGNPVKVIVGGIPLYFITRKSLRNSIALNKVVGGDTIGNLELTTGNRESVFVSSKTLENTPYEYWSCIKRDPEVSMYWDNLGYGVPGYKLINSGIPVEEWDSVNNHFPRVNFSTLTENNDTIKYDFDDCILRRVPRSYSNLEEMFRDWRSQLCEDSTMSIPMSLKATDSTGKIKVFSVDTLGNLNELGNNGFLDLDYIGLYKLVIKSDTKFRISINGKNKDCGFYFYDTSGDVPKTGTLMQDEAYFDPVKGREICFVFYGGEPGAFLDEDIQVLPVSIKIESLENLSDSMRLQVRRDYTNLWTNITINGNQADEHGNIFISNDDPVITYTSNLETRLYGAQYQEKIITKYSSFSSKGSYIKKNKITTIPTRGYQYHQATLDTSEFPKDITYPLRSLGEIEIENPENFNEDRKVFNLYKLPSPPSVVFNTPNNNLLELNYSGYASKTVRVKSTQGSRYTLKYRYEIEEPWRDFTESTEFTQDDLFRIERDPGKDLGDGWEAYVIYENTGISHQGIGPVNIGYLMAESYIPADMFLEDSMFSYDQNSVNTIVGKGVSKTITVTRRDESGSVGTVEGNTGVLSGLGETRVFNLNLLNGETLDLEETLNKCPLLDSESTKCSTGKLTARFKSRFSGVNPFNLYYGYTDSDGYYLQDQEVLVGMNEVLDIPFKVYTDRSIYQVPLKQNPWTTGLRLYYEGMQSSGKVYFGKENTVDLEVESTGKVSIFLLGVKLPVSTDNMVLDYLFKDQETGITCKRDPRTLLLEVSDTKNVPYGPRQQSKAYGYEVKINLPTNETESPVGPYNYEFTDGSGNNKINLRITVKPRKSYYFKLYSTALKSGDQYSVEESDSLTDLVFSASGNIRYPDGSSVYLVTDAPESIVSPYLEAKILKEEGSKVSGVIDCTCEYTHLGEVTSGRSIYELTITSKVKYWKYIQPGSLELTEGFNHRPCKAELKIYLNEENVSNTKTLNAYYGYCNLELSGPYKVYNSVMLFEKFERDIPPVVSPLSAVKSATVSGIDGNTGTPTEDIVTVDNGNFGSNTDSTPGTLIGNTGRVNGMLVSWTDNIYETDGDRYVVINNGRFVLLPTTTSIKYADYYETDLAEESKYSSSHLIDSSMLYMIGGVKAYHNDKTIRLVYTEDTSNPKYKDEFEEFGFYAPFIMTVTREEWVPNSSGGFQVASLGKSKILFNSGEVQLVKQVSKMVDVYHDNKMLRGPENPESININTIGTSDRGLHDGDLIDGQGLTLVPTSNNQAAILLDIKRGEFSDSTGNLVSSNHVINISHESDNSDLCGDEVKFTFNVTVKNVI